MTRRALINFEEFDNGGRLERAHPHGHSENEVVPNVSDSSLEMVQFDAGLVARALVNLAESYNERCSTFLSELRAAVTHEETSRS